MTNYLHRVKMFLFSWQHPGMLTSRFISKLEKHWARCSSLWTEQSTSDSDRGTLQTWEPATQIPGGNWKLATRNPVCVHWCTPRMRTSDQADEGSCWTPWPIQQRQRQTEFLYGCTWTVVPVKRVQKRSTCLATRKAVWKSVTRLYGVRQASLSSSWILWITASTRTQLVKSSQSLLMCSQPPRPSARWWNAGVETTVLQLDVLADQRIYRAQTCATLSVRMMRTLGLTCCWPVTVMMMMSCLKDNYRRDDNIKL